MRTTVVAIAVAFAVFLAGCSVSSKPSQPSDAVSSSVETSIGAEARPDDPSLSHFDSEGRQPEDVVLELIKAGNSSDWEAAYSLYAAPELDFESFAREWEAAAESYQDFAVHETRVIDSVYAIVRVTYSTRTTPPDGVPYAVVIDEPGQWWAVEMTDGLWKVKWLPAQ